MGDQELSLSERFEAIRDPMTYEDREFESIPEAERLHPSIKLCGFLKLAGLMRDPAEFDIHGEHDIVYLCMPDELGAVTDDDIRYLIRCRIRIDGDSGSFARFC